MVKNIAKKTSRFRETVGMFIVKKGGNDWFRLTLLKLLLPVKLKAGNKMEKKWRRGEKKKGDSRRDEQMV